MKQKIRDMENFICGNGKVTKGEWIVLIVTLILPLISFMYMDTESIIRCSIDVGKSIFDGEFWDFYAYSEKMSYQKLMGHLPAYDIVFYLTVGIWQLPIAVIEHLTGEALRFNLPAMIYSKLFLLICLMAAAWMVRKIALELHISKKHATWAAFMFMSSGMMYSYVCITGQYDIMGIFFCLVGVYFYIKNDMLKFALMFAVAVQYKFFAIFIFFPLILLRVKNIWKVVSYLILPVATVFLFKLPFLNDGEAIQGKNEIDATMVERLFGNTLTIFETEVPLSLLAFGGICIWCFFKEVNRDREGYEAIYVPFLSLSALFLSFPFFPYWLVYLTPWIPLLYFMRSDLTDKHFFAEAGMTAGVIMAHYSHFDYVFELSNMEHMLLETVMGSYKEMVNPITVQNFMGVVVSDGEGLYFGIYILCLVTLLILYRPKEKMFYKNEDFSCRKEVWIRWFIQFIVGALPMLLYFISHIRELIYKLL